MKNNKQYIVVLLTACFITICSCRKFIELDRPDTDLIKSTVFEEDNTATAAVIDIYSTMINGISYTNGGIVSSLSYRAGLSADELQLYSVNQEHEAFSSNSLQPTTSTINSSFWSAPYQHIFRVNSVLEGLASSKNISEPIKARLEGEAKFLRAFSYFYLVNMFGDVPLVLTTDYRVNADVSRSTKVKVYNQIIIDLIDAQSLLSSDYLSGDGAITLERTRVNKFAAIALLARVYLYQERWVDAENQASLVIQQNSSYELQPLNGVFLKNSKESIWQLGKDNGNAPDAGAFIFSSVPVNSALRNAFVSTFEPNDQRRTNWIGSRTVGVNTYYFPNKYKITALAPISEYSTPLRLAEQYLIRAEARINQPGKVALGVADLNIIRQRASQSAPDNLPQLSNSISREEAMNAVEIERLHELFTELGHRWFDLKRWPSKMSPSDKTLNRADDILQSLKTGWRKEWKLYPIPQTQILNDPAMANQQNPGYN